MFSTMNNNETIKDLAIPYHAGLPHSLLLVLRSSRLRRSRQ